ncbi:LacI family DNA-binding transcriptional regulator [Caldimonas tepidiphila]|uniref:LacI family DNA-binding transcriptional regulator n=1 Tax=Caldimonas tepidiphila TaxID=2315841 RepID=UPI000E5B1CE6|nr:LacI family DNA-binding transcriptional regulator [Caldimonas tepidiphila]
MASIKDVAQLAGVSTTTVSRVLTDPEAVRPALRERVQQAIARLDYRPNLAARRLRQRRASLIGLIVSDIRNPFFTDISRAVEDMAYRQGLRLILCNADEDPAKEQSYLELMADEQASGVIISPTLEQVGQFRAGRWPFPVVMVDRAPDTTPTDMVLLDNAGAARRLTQHLLESGRRRIVALAGSRSSTGRDRIAGYEAAMGAQGCATQVVAVRPTVEQGRLSVQQLLANPAARPEAVLATNGLLLLGAMQAIREGGLQVPHDIALAGFDNNEWTALPQPGVTVIAQPTYDIGCTAAELLRQRIADPERRPRRIVLDGELIVRGSTAPRGTVPLPGTPLSCA